MGTCTFGSKGVWATGLRPCVALPQQSHTCIPEHADTRTHVYAVTLLCDSLCSSEEPLGTIERAHDAHVLQLAWHPLGHALSTTSNDQSIKVSALARAITPIHPLVHAHMCARAHFHTSTHMHARTHTHTHTLSLSLSLSFGEQ